MKQLMSLLTLAIAAMSAPAFAANAACEAAAKEKKLAGAARNSFVTKCQRDAASGSAQAQCDLMATEKKLAGAARNSFVKKCVTDAGG